MVVELRLDLHQADAARMRRAIIIPSHYPPESGYLNVSGWSLCGELLATRLSQQGYQVRRLASGPGLLERVRTLLNEEPPATHEDSDTSLLLYFAGYVLRTDEAEPALLLADEPLALLRLSQLATRVNVHYSTSLLVLDAASVPERASASNLHESPESNEDSLAHAMRDATAVDSVSSLLSCSAWHEKAAGSSFSAAVVQALAGLSGNPESTSAAEFAQQIAGALPASVPIHLTAGTPTFTLLGKRRFASTAAALTPLPTIAVGASNSSKTQLTHKETAPTATVEPRAKKEDEAQLIAQLKKAWSANTEESALALAEEGIQAFPESTPLLEVVAAVYLHFKRWAPLADLYADLIQRYEDPDGVAKLCQVLATLCLERLEDPARALTAYQWACNAKPKDLQLQLQTATLTAKLGHEEDAELHFRSALNLSPLEPKVYHAATQFFIQTNRQEEAWHAACILKYLGGATDAESQLVEQHAASLLPRVACSLTEADFKLGLNASSVDPQLVQLMQAISKPALAAKLHKPKAQQSLLAEHQREDLTRSTTTLARSFVWTCRLLNIPPPQLYLTDEKGLLGPLPVETPSWLVSKSLGRGSSLRQLAFLWARALFLTRQEHRLLLFYPELSHVLELLHAVQREAERVRGSNAEARRLQRSLREQLGNGQLDQLATTLNQVGPERLESRLSTWFKQVRLSSNRVGLLACGQPDLAAHWVENSSGHAPLSREELLADLFGFAMGETYARLRQQLGLDLGHAKYSQRP